MKLPVLSLSGESAGEVEIDDAIFGLSPRVDILHRMTRYQRARRRSGTNKTKRRGEIRGSTRKIYRQKGTGGARHGSRRANIFRGGGKAHGPRPRDHSHSLPRKFRRLALKHALSAKMRDNALVIIDSARADTPKTGQILPKLEKIGLAKALLVEGAELDKNFQLATRNIPHIALIPQAALNVYEILAHERVALTKAALEGLVERLGEGAKERAA